MKEEILGLDLPEEVKTKLVATYEAAIEEAKEAVRNDADFVSSLKSSEAGKVFASMEGVFKRNFTVDFDDIPDDLKGLKRQEAILKKGIKALQDSKSETAQEWQQKFLDVKNELQRVRDVEIPEIESKARKKSEEKQLAFDVTTVIANLAKEDRLTITPETSANIIMSKLRNTYNVSFEEGKPVIKKGDVFPVFDGKAVKELSGIVENELQAEGLIKMSNGTGGGSSDPIRTPKKGELGENARKKAEGLGIKV